MTRVTRRAFAGALLLAPAIMPSLARAQSPRPVRIGGGLSVEAPQFALAQERDLFGAAGLAPAVTNFPTGREAFEALIGGQVDLAMMAELPVVVGALRAQKFGVVGTLSRYRGMRIVTKKQGGTAPMLATLTGRKFGVTLGTNTHFMLMSELATAGIQAEIVNIGPADLIAALARGDVDAAAPFPNAYAGTRRALGADYAEIPVRSYQPTYLLVASEAFVRDVDVTGRFLSALLKAEAAMATETEAAQAAAARLAGRAQNLEAVRAAWPDYDARISLDRPLLDLMEREGRWLAETGAARGASTEPAVFRAAIAEAPLRAVMPDRVTLD
ncbi:Taurine-binding periplasmic protein precursor [Roseomonas sp. TAS13]|uniref:ABC transporter substrate-binding protein n=1 Tax=Roseomonas sp. TAS13 TaxID=1926319 RepID=UPI00096792F9|nr:ABC transporter substrate-binding protein [Roseomonas sp. TAS13]USQ73782.1 ABC transporter substrate-binding protein [Roseomonas mucosa]GAV32457.1 Taurine-binding periplasmic protein precursor [Roseomonas sp. TAS13]